MKIKNKIKEFVCKNCNCNKAGLLVGTQKDFYEDCLGIDADGVMTDGMDCEVPLRNEVIEQQGGWCPTCSEGDIDVDVIATFEDGTIMDSDSDDIVNYWMEVG